MGETGFRIGTVRGAAGILLLALAFAGCAPASMTLVSAGGDVRRCPLREGDACVERARAGGYVERNQVGGIGVSVAESAEPGRGLRILKVLPGSPAASAGIVPGDYLVRVKGEDALISATSAVSMKNCISFLLSFPRWRGSAVPDIFPG
ncbi:MAG TPA: PDZ domain-containing protein, partial [Candidatus Deferrimicrobiaceae bacterium]